MKIAIKLAIRNLLGAGLRTWLNVGVLSFAFIIILFYNAWIEGWNQQAIHDLIEWEYAGGQLRHADYDPGDPFTLDDAHGILENEQEGMIPVLIRQASIFPNGRMVPIQLKGIAKNQELVGLPTGQFTDEGDLTPAIIGKNFAKNAGLKTGDEVIVRWRDKNGTFDAASIRIKEVFTNNVATTDLGQVWIPVEDLREMTGMQNEATYYLVDKEYEHAASPDWIFHSQDDLLVEFREIIRMERMSGSVMYLLLLGIALLAIFDTQVLSVFRRQKEIGTYISLGMTRKEVVGIFTVEGTMNAVFAAIVGAIYGTPIFMFVAKRGITMPYDTSEVGITIAETVYPVFSLIIILFTILLVVISATIVSFLPSRKIAKMDPVQALKGKVQ